MCGVSVRVLGDLPPNRQNGPTKRECQNSIHKSGDRHQKIVPETHLSFARSGGLQKQQIARGSKNTESVKIDAFFFAQTWRSNGAQGLSGVSAKVANGRVELCVQPWEGGSQNDDHSVRLQMLRG